MSNIWFTSDTHWGHDHEFIWKPRGFNNIWEMNEALVDNWNSVVDSRDDVYHLGDVLLGNSEENIKYLKRLKGNIHIIRGNHDTENRLKLYASSWNVVEITEGQFFKYGKYHFYLNHYPTITSNYDQDKPLKARMINLCGHSHTKDPFQDFDKGLIFHCELDAHNCYPIEINQIINNIKNYLVKNK